MRNMGWLAAFLFMACGALRLARFNTLASVGEQGRLFCRASHPACAGMNAATVLLFAKLGVDVDCLCNFRALTTL